LASGTAAVTTPSTDRDSRQPRSSSALKRSPTISRGSAITRPSGSITALTPVFTARTTARRASIARNRQTARCCSCSSVPSNQPSFEMFTRKFTGSRATYCRAKYGSVSS
jgi:hypothetical protein